MIIGLSVTQGIEGALSSMSIRLRSQESMLSLAKNSGVNITHFLRHRNSKRECFFFFYSLFVRTICRVEGKIFPYSSVSGSLALVDDSDLHLSSMSSVMIIDLIIETDKNEAKPL